MSTALTASKATASQVQIQVPSEYHRAVGHLIRKRVALSALIVGSAYVIVCLALHHWWAGVGAILSGLVVSFVRDPRLSLKHDWCVFVLDDMGLFIKDGSNPVYDAGQGLLSWKRDIIIRAELSSWRELPTVNFYSVRRWPARRIERERLLRVVYDLSDQAVIYSLLQRVQTLFPDVVVPSLLGEQS